MFAWLVSWLMEWEYEILSGLIPKRSIWIRKKNVIWHRRSLITYTPFEMRKSACSQHTPLTQSHWKRTHNVDPPSHQYSTAHKRIRWCTCVVYTFYLVHILATQSAIYRLKITTSVEPNWQRAKRFTHTNICANACSHTHTYTGTHAHTSIDITQWEIGNHGAKRRRMWWRLCCASEPGNKSNRKIETTVCLQFFVRVWARHCGSHINRFLYAASHCIVRTAQIYIYICSLAAIRLWPIHVY